MKACPFCGSNNIEYKPSTILPHHVKCYGCGAVGPHAKSYEVADLLWNKREQTSDSDHLDSLIIDVLSAIKAYRETTKEPMIDEMDIVISEMEVKREETRKKAEGYDSILDFDTGTLFDQESVTWSEAIDIIKAHKNQA